MTASQSAAAGYTALIIAYRDHECVAGVLRQLAAQLLPPNRVLVVDNGGTLHQTDLANMPLADRSQLIPLPENPGYGAAVNAARGQLAAGEALLVLTHDAVFSSQLAEQLLAVLAADDRSRIGCVAPVLHLASAPDRVFSAGGVLSSGGRASHLRQARSDQPYRVDWLDGAIVMYAQTALAAIGWLAEEYFLYFEDVDTGWRLAQHGYECRIVPGQIAHQEPGAHPMYLGVRNMALFTRKAGIGTVRSGIAIGIRIARECLGRLRRGLPLQLGESLRGWRDGRAGISGKPTSHGA